MSTPPLRVMLVDDHEVVRDGIKALLASQDDIIVCAEAATVDKPSPKPTAPPRVIVWTSASRLQRHRGHPRHPRRPPRTKS